MRLFFTVIFLTVSFVRAEAVEIPFDQLVTIEGPFSDYGGNVPVTVDLFPSRLIELAYSGLTSPESAFSFSGSISGLFSLGGSSFNYCFQSVPGPCGDFVPVSGFIIGPPAPIVWNGTLVVYDVFDPSGSGQIISGSLDPRLFFGLDINLPNGFTVASAVPEPSTWTVLLIGFAAIGVASRRHARPQILNRISSSASAGPSGG